MRGQNARFGHVITAMATPFDQSGALNLPAAVALARWLLENGSDALVINGTTGESPTTTASEKTRLVQAVAEAIGSEKVIAGIGGYNTAEVIEAAHGAKTAGAGALLAVVPYYNRPSQEGLFRHFKAVADATDLPVILYNVPTRTVANLEPSTVARIAAQCPNVVGLKEATPNIAQTGEVIRLTRGDFDIYSGADETILPTLALGGAGVISVISHVVGPDIAGVHRAWFAGDREEAARLFLRTLPVTRALFAVPSPAPTKFALRQLGHAVGGVRLPLVDCTEAEGEAIAQALREYGLRV